MLRRLFWLTVGTPFRRELAKALADHFSYPTDETRATVIAVCHQVKSEVALDSSAFTPQELEGINNSLDAMGRADPNEWALFLKGINSADPCYLELVEQYSRFTDLTMFIRVEHGTLVLGGPWAQTFRDHLPDGQDLEHGDMFFLTQGTHQMPTRVVDKALEPA